MIVRCTKNGRYVRIQEIQVAIFNYDKFLPVPVIFWMEYNKGLWRVNNNNVCRRLKKLKYKILFNNYNIKYRNK